MTTGRAQDLDVGSYNNPNQLDRDLEIQGFSGNILYKYNLQGNPCQLWTLSYNRISPI